MIKAGLLSVWHQLLSPHNWNATLNGNLKDNLEAVCFYKYWWCLTLWKIITVLTWHSIRRREESFEEWRVPSDGMTISCSCIQGAFVHGYSVWYSIIGCCEFMLFRLLVLGHLFAECEVRRSTSARISICFHLCFGCTVPFPQIMIRRNRCFCG